MHEMQFNCPIGKRSESRCNNYRPFDSIQSGKRLRQMFEVRYFGAISGTIRKPDEDGYLN